MAFLLGRWDVDPDTRRIASDGDEARLSPKAMGVLAWAAWPSVRRAWAILEGPISVGGIPASFLLKSLIPAFCVLLLIQGLACLLRDLLRLAGRNGGEARA